MEFYDNHQVAIEVDNDGVNRYVAKVFGWMFLGLILTALSTFFIVVGIQFSTAFAQMIASLSQLIFVVFIAQVLLVGYISVRVEKMNPSTAVILFLLYAITNGFTVGLFALLYAGSVIVTAFAITAVSFGVMAVYGLKTNQDLTKMGNLLRMGLIGLIILSVVNIFMGNSALDFLICLAGLVIFLGLTAHDTKKIKSHYAQVSLSGDVRLANNLAIIGALSLYLNFINLFMFILRLMTGGRR
ncbi:MAG: Bax inhibitor-1/YccA family protein [Defluviitaleaceae bacterium]|nr:Bax inhibitor-1/YccA family protein [Defluviitaleaceae bacterium]